MSMLSAPLRLKGLLQWAGLALLCLCSCSALAEAKVRVEANAAIINVYAEIETSVGREMAWSVLTDYNRWSEFMPDLLVCRVISSPGEPLRLEQRGRFPQLPNFPLVMILMVEESPPKAIRFQRIAGNIRALAGEWLIQGKAPVRLVYRSSVMPGFAVPPEMSIEIFRQEAKARLEAMAREMARREGAPR